MTQPVLASPRRRLQVWRALVPYVISLTLLGWVVASTDLQAFRDALLRARPLPVLAMLAITALLMAMFDAWNAAWLCRRLWRNVPLVRLARARLGMQLLNTTHFAAGQGGFGAYIARCCHSSVAAAAGVVALLVVGALLGLVVLASGAVLIEGWRSVPAEVLTFIVVVAGSCAACAGFWSLRRRLKLRWRVADADLFLPFRQLRARDWFIFIGSRVGILLISMVGQYLALGQFGAQLSFATFATRWPLIQMIIGLPISVAGVGTGQLAWTYLLQGAAPEAQLLAFSLVWGVGHAGASALIGLPFVRRTLEELFRANQPVNSPDLIATASS